MAPLSILIVAICSLFFNHNTAEQEVLVRVTEIAGASSAETVRTLLNSAHHGSGIAATAVAFLTLLFGASGVFVELRDSLNTIWEAPPPKSSGLWAFAHQRLVSFAMVLGLCILLLGSLLLSAGLAIVQKLFSGIVPLHISILSQIANLVLELLAFAILFALIFKFVPNVPIRWQEVVFGSLATAILFTLGKALLALYFATAAVGSTYGAAGSLVALVVWVYYSAQIFFFGAVLTRVYADHFGSPTANKQRTAIRATVTSPTKRGQKASTSTG